MLKGFIWLDRPQSDEDIKHLRDNALAENHDIFYPTHIAKKNGIIVGYFSIGTPGFPMVPCWFGNSLSPRDSFSLVNSVENHVALSGAYGVGFPVPKDSPFYPLMESMGYRSVGEYTFFVKKF